VKQILTLAACVTGTLLSAQVFTTWTTAQGLPSNDLRDIAIAADGTIWLATSEGVVAFDGTNFTVHNTTSHPGLAANDVYAIAATSTGEVWAGTDFGVSVFDGSTHTTYTTANGLGDDVIRNIKEAPNGDVWIATINGATRFSASSFTAFGSPEIPFGGTTYIAFAGNGDVLLGGGLGGMIVYNGSTFSTVTTAGGLLSNRIRSIAVNAAQERWVATSDGISVLDAANAHITDHGSVFTLPPPDELNPITDILVDDFGRVWAGVYVDYLVTEGGVSMYNGTDWTQWETSDGLAGPNVTRIAMDEDGNLWIATSTGLTRMSGINIGIAENTQAASFQVFPNPATSTITLVVDTQAGQQRPFEIYDAQSRRVMDGTLASGRSTIDVSTFDVGVYVARIGNAMQRFVVAR
jgi:ligand-binding sensor domain-containing protein